MTKPEQAWNFPFCPTFPQWDLDWQRIQAQFSWIRAMEGIPQNPVYHAEGDVLIHTRMVTEAMVKTEQWRTLPPEEQSILFASVLLHDVGKPDCTVIEHDGHISSRGHACKGEHITRQILWTGGELADPAPFKVREYIARLVRFHGLPLQFLEREEPERAIIAASQSIRMKHIALLAEADVRGRICADQHELLERVALFRAMCQELQCYDGPRSFPTDHSRFVYFHSSQSDLNYKAYDDTTFEVILMSGLPGAGKDSWICKHYTDWPVISLDAIRRMLKIAPEAEQGRVVQTAKEQARELMRQQRSFIWNATNITRMIRQQLIDFFVSYGGHVHIVYLDAPFVTIIQRNRQRRESVPEQVIEKLLMKLEVPTLTEAHKVEWISHC